jgi:hypothetical protein
MDRVGFEPTTSAMPTYYRKKIVQIPPCFLNFRSLEMLNIVLPPSSVLDSLLASYLLLGFVLYMVKSITPQQMIDEKISFLKEMH